MYQSPAPRVGLKTQTVPTKVFLAATSLFAERGPLHKFRCIFCFSCLLRHVKLHALGDKVNPAHVVAVGVVLQRPHGRVHLLVRHGHPLDCVPRPSLLNLDNLTMSGELIGDLPDSGHPRIGELYGEVSVPVRHYPHVRCGCQCWELNTEI